MKSQLKRLTAVNKYMNYRKSYVFWFGGKMLNCKSYSCRKIKFASLDTPIPICIHPRSAMQSAQSCKVAISCSRNTPDSEPVVMLSQLAYHYRTPFGRCPRSDQCAAVARTTTSAAGPADTAGGVGGGRAATHDGRRHGSGA